LRTVLIGKARYEAPPWICLEQDCQSNLRQIGIGTIQYVQDYDQRYPVAKEWVSQLYPYEKSTGVFHCPNDPHMATSTTFPVSYAINRNVDRQTTDKLTASSVTVLACDYTSVSGNETVTNDTASSSNTDGSDKHIGVWGETQLGYKATMPTIHDPAVMFLATDGHVKALRPEQVSGGVNAKSSKNRATPLFAAGTKAMGAGQVLTFSVR